MNIQALSPPLNRWWLEREFFLVLAVLCVSYFPRLGLLPVRGEESRRARVSFEMVDSGDWVVPREQGDPFLSRPPFQNWLIALSSLLTGNRSPLSIRIPSVLAVLCMITVIYGYCRHFLGSVGSLTAALAFFTGAEMLKTGRSAETEALYVFLIGSSLLLWHLGVLQKWKGVVTWTVAYCLTACACLSKGGLQPPIYLLGTTGVYLLLTRKWKDFFAIGHFLGAIIGASIVGTWYWWCAQRTGWDTTSAIWMSDTASRFSGWKIREFLQHLVSFPVETFGCLMPWSPMLLAFCWAPFRNSLENVKPAALFCGVAACIAFLTIWIPPDGATRYFMPLYPCVAVLVGIVVDRFLHDRTSLASNRLLPICATVIAICFFAIAVGLPITSMLMSGGRRANYVPGFSHALFYSFCLVIIALLIFRHRDLDTRQSCLAAMIGIALGAAVLSNGIVDDVRISRTPDTAAAVARLKKKLPTGARLVSIGHVHHLFAYYYDALISPEHRFPTPEKISPGEYFCFNWKGDRAPVMPRDWEEIARIKVNRFADQKSSKWVIVARPTPQAANVHRPAEAL